MGFYDAFDAQDNAAAEAAPPPPPGGYDPGAYDKYVTAAVADEVARVQHAANGTRNHTLNEAAFALYRFTANGVLPRGVVEHELYTAAVAVGLPHGEIMSTLASAYRGRLGKPRHLPELREDRSTPEVTVLDDRRARDHADGDHQAADEEHEDAATGAGFTRSWQPVDLAQYLTGAWKPDEPTVGRRLDGVGMFYRGKCHTIASETEGGKTWLALAAVTDELTAGEHVLYIDFEDDAGPMVGRLLTLQVAPQVILDQFHYIRPEGPVGTGINLDDITQALRTHRPTLGIVDGVTEGMTLHGLDPLSNTDCAVFGRMIPRLIANHGAAAVSLDHVTKSTDGRGRYAIGAVHKLNGLDGAAYVLENRIPFGIGRTGKSTIKISKDRPGHLRKRSPDCGNGMQWFGDLVIHSHAEAWAEITVEAPPTDQATVRPTRYMERVAKTLEGRPDGLAQRVIIDTTTGSGEHIKKALSFLIADGYVSQKTPHKLLKSYPPGQSQ